LELARQIAARARGPRAAKPAKPRRKNDDPQPLGELVDGLVAERGWQAQLGVHQLMARWPELVGDINAAHTVPESYDDGVLVVRAESTAWMTSIRQLAPQLVAKLNERLGQGSVIRIQVIGPQAPSWKKGRRSVPGRGPRDTYG
jgi:predicted nucleic acid-binding Zn ribbon protein